MIENALVFALGALSAGILALILFPAFTRRAARLARKSAEARLPKSAAELAAAKDAVRAEYAARTARIEYDYTQARKALVDERLGNARAEARLATTLIENRDLQSALAAAELRIDELRTDLRAREETVAKLAAENRGLERRLHAEEARIQEAEARADEAEHLATEMRAALIAAEANGIALADGRYRLAALAGTAMDGGALSAPSGLPPALADLRPAGTPSPEVPSEVGGAVFDETLETDPPPLHRVTASLLAIRSAASTLSISPPTDRPEPTGHGLTDGDEADGDEANARSTTPIAFPPLPVPAVGADRALPPDEHAKRIDDLAQRLRSLRARNGASRSRGPAVETAEKPRPAGDGKAPADAELPTERREPAATGSE